MVDVFSYQVHRMQQSSMEYACESSFINKKKKIPESCPLKVADDGRVGKALLEIYHLSAVLG